MDSVKRKDLYTLIKTVTLDYFKKEENCIIAEYQGQKLSHGYFLLGINDILAHARSKKFIDEYRKYMPLTSDDLVSMMEKLCDEGILFKMGYERYALNRKLAKPVGKWVSEYTENKYLEKLKLNNLMPYFDELNKLSLENKLKHRILFNTLPGEIITQLIDLGIHTYYDLVTLRRFVAWHNLNHLVQTHLHLLNLELDMYEWTGKIKQDKNNMIELTELLSKLHTDEITFDVEIKPFDEKTFLFKGNNDNFVKWFKHGLEKYRLEKYFNFDILSVSDLKTKSGYYGCRDKLYCVRIANDFSCDEICVLLKLIS